MKKIISFLLTFIMLVFAVVSCDTECCENTKSDGDKGSTPSSSDDKGIWVEKLDSYLSGLTTDNTVDVLILDTSPDMKVLKSALYKNYTKKVNLDLSLCTELTTIGKEAFHNNVTELKLPLSVTSIDSQGIYQCTRLVSLSIDASNDVYYSQNNAIITKDNPKTLVVGCKNTVIPDDVIKIGDYAFYSCSGLTGNLNIPNSVTSIGKSAFSQCTGLRGELKLPNNLKSIDYGAFQSCTGLTGDLNIPDTVTSIGGDAFCYCSGLNGKLKFSNKLESISYGMFLGCRGLTEVVIPNTIKSIGEEAFKFCGGLTEVVVSSSVTSIGKMVFYYCEKLTSVTFESAEPPTLGSDVFGECPSLTTIYVPDASVTTYKAVDKLSKYEVKSISEKP